MILLRRAWRYVFARSDLPSDSPLGLDDTRMLWTAIMFTAPFVAFGVVQALSVAFVPRGFTMAMNIIALVATVATLLAVGYHANTRIAPQFAVRRAAIAGPARAAGWTYSDASPLPSPQTLEAVFHYSRDRLVSESFTEVSAGAFNGHRFTAGHLAGRERREAGETGRGRPRSENVVLVSLPGLLPELKLRDRSTSNIRDYGVSLAVAPTGDPAFDRRWEVQTNFADFAADLFTPELRAFLAAVALVPCTIVIRNGYIIASRDPEATFSSITARLEILTGVIERLPAGVWARETTPQVAGATLRTAFTKAASGPVL